MSTPTNYVPSRLQPGDAEEARQRAFTHWMSPDLRQAATDFCRNLGHVVAYSETSAEGARYLFWRMPSGANCEVRSGRTLEQFIDFDAKNQRRGRRLLTLHLSPEKLYSAVWISPDHFDTAVTILRLFGISPAERIKS